MSKQCAVCSRDFEAKRPSAKYCGATCRKRASRSPGKVVAAKTASAEPDTDLPLTGSVYLTTHAELVAVERLDTPGGQAALVLARRIDRDYYADTASGVAALVREHRATLAEAVLGAAKKSDPLEAMRDELKERRERRNAG